MLQSKDLRIGNYIMQGGKITCVEKLSRSIDDWDRTNGKRTQDCHAIPLTEEWLLNFGFECLQVDNFSHRNSFQLDSNLGFVIWGRIETGLFLYIDGNEGGEVIKYVHQLQNLYFALTGKELLKGVYINTKY
jgi:hypothetical protein